MAVYTENLFSLNGQVRAYKPNASAMVINTLINNRIRLVLDSVLWADLISDYIISIPAGYSTGTVNLTRGSNIATGVGTAWPTTDKVNTTLAEDVSEIGYVEATPTSMTDITVGQYLYIGSEAVCVSDVTTTTFTAKFTATHNAGDAIVASSLAGRQLRVSNNDPIFTVKAATTATSVLMDKPWGGAVVNGSTYEICGMYYPMPSDFKDIVAPPVDKQFGYQLRYHVSQSELNWRDPQRSSSGTPQLLADYAPNEAGQIQYEIWPKQNTERQIWLIYRKYWPKLENPGDKPPWFINPAVWVHGATADVLRMKVNENDSWYDPVAAREHEMLFMQALELSKADNTAKIMNEYTYKYQHMYSAGGANFWQSHDPDLYMANFG
jgi:hypothetical protein